MEFTENKIAAILAIVAVVAAVAMIGGDQILSGLEFEDNCEWVSEIEGQTFDSLEDLENTMGEEIFQEVMNEVEEKPDLEIREDRGIVEYKRCTTTE